jgi:hypothetical protein
VASVDLVLEFKRFPWVLGTVSYARDGMARSPVSAPQPWSAAVRLRRGRGCPRGRLGAGSCAFSAGLGGCRGLFGRLFMCHVDVSCPICRVSVRSAVGGWRGLSVGLT